ncbi:MAG: hypothetical protein CL832_10885 [Crocinitomicaceae bacterium]|nr:hypothetical protein [Crocinitomicaceae bacterium]|tara:strand:- start:30 stop:497 length:468 start_codon:yes stop_codon:yes gene_type:complete
MSILKVDTINEKTSGNGVAIPGHVIQFLSMRTDGSRSTTSTSLSDTGLTLTITPKSTSSKIVIFANMYEIFKQGANTSPMFAINRAGTIVGDHQASTQMYTTANEYENVQIQYVDEPSTTSATEYKIQYKSSNGNTVYVNGDNTQNHFMLMEIAQ